MKVTPNEFDKKYYQNAVNDFIRKKQERIKQESEKKELEEAQALTFKPELNLKNSRKSSMDSQPFHERLQRYQSHRDIKLEQLRVEIESQRELNESKELTFKPKINQRYFSPDEDEAHIAASSFFAKDPLGILTHGDSKRSPKEALMNSVEIQNFRPLLNDMTEKLAAVYIAETSPDVVERLLNLYMRRLEKLKQLAEKEKPSFSPTLSPYTEKLFQNKIRGNSVNKLTKNNLSYIAAQEELRERLNRSQEIKERSPGYKSRSKSSLLGTTRSSLNLRANSEVLLNQADLSRASNPQQKLLESSESKKNLTDDELISLLKEMRKKLGLDDELQEDQQRLESSGQKESFDFDFSSIEQNLLKLQEALQATRMGKSSLHDLADSRIVEEGGIEGSESDNTSRLLSMSGRRSEREKQSGNKRMSDEDLHQSQTDRSQGGSKQLNNADKRKNSADSRKQGSKEKARSSVYPDADMFSEGNEKKSTSKTGGRKGRETGEKGSQKSGRSKNRSPDSKGNESSGRNSSAEKPERKNSGSLKKSGREKARMSVYPDAELFEGEEEDQDSDAQDAATRERASSNPKDTRERASSLTETRERASSNPRERSLDGRGSLAESEMFDINEVEEGSDDSAENKRNNSKKSATNKKDSKAQKTRPSVYPDKGMFAERGTKKAKSRDSVYPDQRLFQETASNRQKNKSRDSVYPDKGLFQEKEPKRNRNKQRESVYPGNEMYDEGENGTRSRKSSKASMSPERGVSTDRITGNGSGSRQDLSQSDGKASDKRRPNSQRKEKSRGSVYPDQKMFEERGAKNPKNKTRGSVYPDKALFQERGPAKNRNKQRESVYAGNEMYDEGENGIRSRKSSKASMSQELGMSSDQNAGNDSGSRKELSQSEEPSAGKRGTTKNPKNKTRDSVYPDQKLFQETASSKQKNKSRDSVYPDKDLFQERGPKKSRSKQRDSVYPGNMYDDEYEDDNRNSKRSSNQENEVSSDRNVRIKGSSKTEISHSETVSINKTRTKQSKEKYRNSVYPDQEMFAGEHSEDNIIQGEDERNASKGKRQAGDKSKKSNAERGSVYPGKGMFAEKDPNREKNKQRGSVYPDTQLFEDGENERVPSKTKGNKKSTKEKQKKSGQRGSVYPGHEIFGEEHDEGDESGNKLSSGRNGTGLEEIPEEGGKNDNRQRRNTGMDKNQSNPNEIEEDEQDYEEENDVASNTIGKNTKTTKGRVARSKAGRNYKNPTRPKRFQTPDNDNSSSGGVSAERDQRIQDSQERYQEIEEEFLESKAKPAKENEDSLVEALERRNSEKQKMIQMKAEDLRQMEADNLREIEILRQRQMEAERLREKEAERLRQMEAENEAIQQALAMTEIKAKKLEEELRRAKESRESRRSNIRIDVADGYSYSPEESKLPARRKSSTYEEISVPTAQLFKIEFFNKELREAPKESQTLKTLGASTKMKYANYQSQMGRDTDSSRVGTGETDRSARGCYERPESQTQPRRNTDTAPPRPSVLKKEQSSPQLSDSRRTSLSSMVKFTKTGSHFIK